MKRAFLFPGQGAQTVGMGKDIYEKYEEAKKIYEKASEISGIDIKKICFEGPEEELNKTENTIVKIWLTIMLELYELGFNCARRTWRSKALSAIGIIKKTMNAKNFGGIWKKLYIVPLKRYVKANIKHRFPAKRVKTQPKYSGTVFLSLFDSKNLKAL